VHECKLLLPLFDFSPQPEPFLSLICTETTQHVRKEMLKVSRRNKCVLSPWSAACCGEDRRKRYNNVIDEGEEGRTLTLHSCAGSTLTQSPTLSKA